MTLRDWQRQSLKVHRPRTLEPLRGSEVPGARLLVAYIIVTSTRRQRGGTFVRK